MSEKEKTPSSKKTYPQHYRKKWEQIPQLRGWLGMFPHKDPEQTKAFCKYCQKKLVPHVTGLLKHAACKVHQKHARAYMDRIKETVKRAEERAKLQKATAPSPTTPRKSVGVKKPEDSATSADDLQSKVAIIVGEALENEDLDEPADIDHLDDHTNNDMDRFSDEEENDVMDTIIPDPLSQQVKIRVVMDDALMSTHVIDTCRGMPVIGLGVSLYRLQDGRWTLLSDSVTDAEGRCSDLLKDNSISLQAGRYKMHYDVSQYYAIRSQECFFPFIEVVFDISNPTERYHIPLLLSPFSYSTYRGS